MTITTPATASFQLHYRKHKYTPEKIESSLLYDIQNYIPIYSRFFDINETNYNGIQLNQRYYLQNIVEHSIMESTTATDRANSTSLNHLETVIADDAGNTTNVPMFVKYSPLLDPIRYLSGKYEAIQKSSSLPKYNSTIDNCDDKILNTNNSSYVDGFFSYLSSQLLNHHDFIHGLDFYGFFNATKNNFHYNVIDDIDYLDKNQYFNKHRNVLFSVEDIESYSIDSGSNQGNKNGTRNMKHKIKIENNATSDGCDGEEDGGLQYVIPDDFDSVCKEFKGVFNDTSSTSTTNTIVDVFNNSSSSSSSSSSEYCITDINTIELPPSCDGNFGIDKSNVDNINTGNSGNNNGLDNSGDLEEFHIKEDGVSSSDSETESCSSRSSYTDDDNDDDGCAVKSNGKMINDAYENDIDIDSGSGSRNDSDRDGDGDDSILGSEDDDGESSEYDSQCDDEDDDTLWATIHNFPVSAIMLEKCDDTLDSLMMQEEDMKDGEWKSALFQIIMTLITYQKAFGFTHNDLHTNNVMFVYTEKEYIYYLYNKKYYRVPTYNRIFKIIDFGRAIYRYKSKVICSDSFSMTGDAATQYNCEPYLNDKKPRLDPNFSFDLCRLGCSIFDYFIDNISDVNKICKENPIAKLIVEWVTDDQNRNILYKTNGEERYPDFKLYKMIARNVHNHTPQSQLSKSIFSAYEFPKKQVKQKHRIINIDKIPSYII